MAIQLSEPDHRLLDDLLDTILEANASGEVTPGQARAALAHVFTAAAIDNEGEVRAWLQPDQQERWKAECSRSV